MVTKQTTEYLSSTSDYRTGQRFVSNWMHKHTPGSAHKNNCGNSCVPFSSKYPLGV